jgi:hypothetical protein
VTAPIELLAPASHVTRGYGSWPQASPLLATGVYLYAGLFTVTGTPFLLGGGQVFFWMNAQRALYGELIYRDFLEVTPPGTDLIYLGPFELFGPRMATTPVAAQKLTWLAQHTSPGQYVFQAVWPSIYLPLAVRNPVFLDNLDTGYKIRPDYLQLTIR